MGKYLLRSNSQSKISFDFIGFDLTLQYFNSSFASPHCSRKSLSLGWQAVQLNRNPVELFAVRNCGTGKQMLEVLSVLNWNTLTQAELLAFLSTFLALNNHPMSGH